MCSPGMVPKGPASSPDGRPGCGGPIAPRPGTIEPPPDGPVGAQSLGVVPGRSAADPEDLAAALRAGALERRLAVLHRDLLRVLDLDLGLVLDAVSLSHGVCSSSRNPRHESTPLESTWSPGLALIVGPRATGASCLLYTSPS